MNTPLVLEQMKELIRVKAINADLLEALRHIAITDDLDCRHANSPKVMSMIARDAISKATQ